MTAVPIELLVGPGFRLLSRAYLDGQTVHGQMDYPPAYPALTLSDHNPETQFLPGVVMMAMMEEVVQNCCLKVTRGWQFPALTSMPTVEFMGMVKPGEVDVIAQVHLQDSSGEATCHILTDGRRKAEASFAFGLTKDPRRASLDLGLQIASAAPTDSKGSASTTYQYRRDGLIPFPNHETPWPLILEGLSQCACQIVHSEERLAKALLLVTHLEGTTFHRPCPVGTVDLVTQVEWIDGRRRGLVHAAASCDGQLIVDGNFGIAVFTRR
jgi:3-hydroxymyristoyl/3-hydroxydecanoyl-(acyl carrier protein) dehydratase